MAKTCLEAIDSIAAFMTCQTLANVKISRLILNVYIKAHVLLMKKGQIFFNDSWQYLADNCQNKNKGSFTHLCVNVDFMHILLEAKTVLIRFLAESIKN